ncbi:TonB-dependent receptor; Outer membrane receptor for ferrienterochelin and colicins [Vibrio chagasii]|nr:TonB-dependent receptor; Outer membrane receptor for ferrienterochelin and colicins [Vibrio chagasii]CAH7166277.1 TonB-dependent receptor; Outer membrane receptor for ferrienterochelin and colicins [Vibrio chagasii]
MISRPISLGLALTTSACVVAQENSLDQLMSMSLEELSMLDVEMETASKVTQKLTDIPSSVYVLSNERIQRSGAKTIAEALKLVPGLKVTKFNETSWFVSARGFHDGLYNKMLVMMDGRSLFSPVYGGTYWSDVDYVLADIERIEVLKGPGGTIWGGNAANGVVNIITKSASETQGTYISGLASNTDNYEFSVRQGLSFNASVNARAFYKYREEPTYRSNESEKWKAQSAGMVFQPSDSDQQWSLRIGGEKSFSESELYSVQYDSSGTLVDYQANDFDNESHSFYLQFNDSRSISDTSTFSYSLWGEYNEDNAPDAPGSYTTVDFDSTLIKQLSTTHQITVGGGLRYLYLDFSSSQVNEVDWYNPDYYGRAYDVESANDYIANAFMQSQVQWTEALSVTLGAKLEHFTQNDSTEVSPQVRGLYKLNLSHSLWAGVSKAVVAPSYMDSNSAYYFNSYYPETGVSYLDLFKPNNQLNNEDVVTIEMGYRYTNNSDFELDATIYLSEHDNLRFHSYDPSDIPANHVYVGTLSDDYQATTYGLEIGASYQLTPGLSSYFGYAYSTLEGKRKGDDPNSSAQTSVYYDIDNQHLATVQLMWNITDSWQFDVIGQYINVNYPDYWVAEDGTQYSWQSYPHELVFDARLAWKKSHAAPLVEVVIENIGKGSGYQAELTSPKSVNQESVYVRVSHEF